MRYLIVPMLLATMQCAAQQTAGTGSLSGRVVDAVTNDAIPGAKIIVGCMNVKIPEAICTEHPVSATPDGTFRADGLPAGNYLLISVNDKYLGQQITPTVIIEAGQEQSNILLKLLKEAVIRGKVLDANGKPLPGMNVEALRVHDHHSQVVSSANTDPNGSYTLNGLRAGKYFVVAQKDSPAFFFPDGAPLENAQGVELEYGQEFVDANVRVRSVPVLTVTGRVADFEALQDKKALTVRLYSHAPEIPGLSVPQSSLTADGRFQFDHVASGDYVLVLQQKAPIDEKAYYLHVLAKQDVTVRQSNITNVTLVVIPKINLTGKVVLSNSSSAELSRTEIALRPYDVFFFSDFKKVNPDEDGLFMIAGCDPARHSFKVEPPTGTYIERIEYGRQPTSSHLLDFSSGTAGELVIRLKRGTATIEGTIPSDAEDGYVYLIPDGWKPDDWREVKQTTTSKHSFSFANVAPGRYTLIGVNQKVDDLSGLAGNGQMVELNPGDQKRVELPNLKIW